MDTKTLNTFQSNQILKNTEQLSQFQNYLKTKILYKEIEIIQFYEAIDIGSFCRLIVQNIYLLQISYLFKLKIYISRQIYVQKAKYINKLHNLNVFQLYCFQKELQNQNIEMNAKRQILQTKFNKIFSQNFDRIEDFFTILNQLYEMIMIYLDKIQNSQKKQNSTSLETQINKKYLTQFFDVYRNVIKPQKNRVQQPKFLLKILQQTKLFRTHSILVKLVNCSLFYSIKSSPLESTDQLTKYTKKLNHLFQMRGNQNPRIKRDTQILIDQFITYLCRINIIQIAKSLKGISEEEQVAKQNLALFDYEEGTIPEYSTISASISIPERKYLVPTSQLFSAILNDQNLLKFPMEKEAQPPKSIETQILYTFQKNQIKIRCLSEIDIGVDNADYLNYLITMFNDGMKGALFIDTIDKFRKSASKKKQKIIMFKITYIASNNEQPLTKILELIDVCMLASKIFTFELSKKSYIKVEDYSKRQNICDNFRHYENIFRNIIRKFYSQIQNIQTSK